MDLSQPIVSGSSASAAELTMVDNPLAARYEASRSLPTSSIATQPIDLGASTSAADTPLAAEPGALPIQTTPEDAIEQSSLPKRRIIKLRQRAKCNISDSSISAVLTLRSGAPASNSVTVTIPFMSGSSPAAAVVGALATKLDNKASTTPSLGGVSPSQPITFSTSAAEFTTAHNPWATGHEVLQSLLTSSGPTDPSQPLPYGSSTSTTKPAMVDSTGTSVARLEASSSASGLSQPTLDLGASISAADTSLTAEPGAPLLPTTPSDATIEQKSSSSKKRAKQRKRAKCNTSDSFIQHCIDFTFRCTGIQHCKCHNPPHEW